MDEPVRPKSPDVLDRLFGAPEPEWKCVCGHWEKDHNTSHFRPGCLWSSSCRCLSFRPNYSDPDYGSAESC